MMKTLSRSPRLAPSHAAGVVLAAAAAATAVWVRERARQAEHDHPPDGRFIHIDGVRLHYLLREESHGAPVVLLHGNMLTHADFLASGLVERLARHHTVLAFDRPGFGHSTRPRDRHWTPRAQAELLHRAIAALGLQRPVLLGHSLGTMVALAMALDYPASVAGLVLLGGYYYPSVRLDSLLVAPVAVPVLGDVLRHTVAAVSARLLLERMARGLFAPHPLPPGFFAALPRELLLRPSQLRANAEDGACMAAEAGGLCEHYARLKLPVTLMAGAEDRVVDREAHTGRLHEELAGSELLTVPGAGHMLHYAAPDAVAQAVDRMAA